MVNRTDFRGTGNLQVYVIFCQLNAKINNLPEKQGFLIKILQKIVYYVCFICIDILLEY